MKRRNNKSNHGQQNMFLSDFSTMSVKSNCILEVFQFWIKLFKGEHYK